MLETFVIQSGKGSEMSSHIITDSPDFHHTPRFVGHSPDGPDGLHTTLGEDSDLDIKIYRKNGSQVRSFHKFAVVNFGRGEVRGFREHWQKYKGFRTSSGIQDQPLVSATLGNILQTTLCILIKIRLTQ